MNIKVFGERNTGTNALSSVLRSNSASTVFPGTMAELDPLAAKKASFLKLIRAKATFREAQTDKVFRGRPISQQWKHTATNFDCGKVESNIHFIFTVRHPLSWLLSLYKNPYHVLAGVPGSFEEFMEMEWKALERDNLPGQTYRPVELYEAKLFSYIQFMKDLDRLDVSFSVVKFEDFAQDQSQVFDRLRGTLERASDDFIELHKSTKDPRKNVEYYRDYYGNELWRDEISDDVEGNFSFDASLLKVFGYTS